MAPLPGLGLLLVAAACAAASAFVLPAAPARRLARPLSAAPPGGASRRDALAVAARVVLATAALSARSSPAAARALVEVLAASADIDRPPLDVREFRSVELSNGVRALLVSDRDATTAAGAAAVSVGHYMDPEALPGLAHFCEHMCFLGTDRYPDEDDFAAFTAAHGGSNNAYTDAEDTVYYFDVAAESLAPAVQRFARFFVAPLFKQGATDRELNAIDAENSKNLQSDAFRLYQLEKSARASPDHPHHKVGFRGGRGRRHCR